MLAFTAFIVTVAYWPDFDERGETARWIVLSLCIPFATLTRPLTWTPAHLCGLVWLGYAALTLAWTPSPADGGRVLWHFMLLGGAFALGAASDARELRTALLAFAAGIAINALIACAQAWFGYALLPQQGRGGALFVNKNYLAEAAVIALAASIAYRAAWAIPGALLATFVPNSRAAIAGAIMAMVPIVWRRSRAAALIMAAGAIAAPIAIFTLLPVSDTGITMRLAFWRTTLEHLTLSGHGIGSFLASWPTFGAAPIAGAWGFFSDPSTVHNDLLELAHDTGAAALLLAGLVAIALWRGWPRDLADERTAPAAAIVAFLVCTTVDFPLGGAAPAFMAAVCAGQLCRARHDVCVELRPGRGALSERVDEPVDLQHPTRHDPR